MDAVPFWLVLLIFFMFVLLPGAISVIGWRMIVESLRFKERAQPVIGTVVEVKKTYTMGEGDSDQYSYQPVFEYESPDGQILRGTSAISAGWMNYEIGSKHSILADFANPEIVRTKGSHGLIVGVATLLIGGAMAVFGVSALVSML